MEHKNKGLDEKYLVRWYSTGHSIMGEHDEVYAAAFVRRPPDSQAGIDEVISDVVLSNNSMAIDGDRPVRGDYMHFVRQWPVAVERQVGFTDDDSNIDTADDDDGNGIYLDAERGTGSDYHAVTLAGIGYAKEFKGGDLRIATGFDDLEGLAEAANTEGVYPKSKAIVGDGASPKSRIVLGIQDTLIAYLELSDPQYSNIRTNVGGDWEIVLTVGGQRSSSNGREYVEKSGGSKRTVLKHKDAIAENEYGDLSNEPLILTAFIEDSAGNKAATASIDGIEADDATVTTAILVDGIKPSLASREGGTGVTELKGWGSYSYRSCKTGGRPWRHPYFCSLGW